jgi:hypothetical protein
MKPRCIASVGAALGRDLTVAETRNIEQRISDAMRMEARRDPAAWQSMSIGDRLRVGAEMAAKEIVEEATLKKVRVGLQVQAWDRVDNYLTEQVAHGFDDTRLDALDRLLAPKNDGKNNVISVESNAAGIEAVAMGRLVDAWEAISPRFLGLFKNKDAEEAFIMQAHGVDTGLPEMKRAVDAWAETTEALRTRFNAAGGNIGKLDNWGMPHAWSQKLAVSIGKDAWANKFMGLVDRNAYVHEDGRLYSDAEMKSFLESAWLTVATDGANKLKPEPLPGGAVKANRNSQARQIHFKDGAVNSPRVICSRRYLVT